MPKRFTKPCCICPLKRSLPTYVPPFPFAYNKRFLLRKKSLHTRVSGRFEMLIGRDNISSTSSFVKMVSSKLTFHYLVSRSINSPTLAFSSSRFSQVCTINVDDLGIHLNAHRQRQYQFHILLCKDGFQQANFPPFSVKIDQLTNLGIFIKQVQLGLHQKS